MIEFVAQKNQKISLAIKDISNPISYSLLMKCLRKKDVKINGKRVSSDQLLSIGDKVQIYCEQTSVEPVNTLYLDENIIIVDKKSGFTAESVFEYLSKIYAEIYFLHRLDRNTCGLMVFAFNKVAERELLTAFKKRSIDKIYHALVYGKLQKKEQVLSAYLVKDSDNSLVKIYNTMVKNSAPIKTGYKVIKEYENSSLLEVTLYTGKTHQIRAHLASIGHFIIGDGKYGENVINKQFNVKSQKLIAKKLTFHFDGDSALNYLDNKSFISEFNI